MPNLRTFVSKWTRTSVAGASEPSTPAIVTNDLFVLRCGEMHGGRLPHGTTISQSRSLTSMALAREGLGRPGTLRNACGSKFYSPNTIGQLFGFVRESFGSQFRK